MVKILHYVQHDIREVNNAAFKGISAATDH